MKALLFLFLMALALAVPLLKSIPKNNDGSAVSIMDYPLYRMKDFLQQHNVALASIDESGPVVLPAPNHPEVKVMLYPETLKTFEEECAKRRIPLRGV